MKSAISWNEYYEAYEAAAPEIKSCIDNGEIGNCLEKANLEIENSDKQLLIIEIANYLVGLSEKEDILEAFSTIDKEKLDNIFGCLEATISKPPSSAADSPSYLAPPAPAGLRTMAADIEHATHPNDAPNYTSSQAALLRESRPSGETTSANQPVHPPVATKPAQPTPSTPAKDSQPAAAPEAPAPANAPFTTTPPRWDSER